MKLHTVGYENEMTVAQPSTLARLRSPAGPGARQTPQVTRKTSTTEAPSSTLLAPMTARNAVRAMGEPLAIRYITTARAADTSTAAAVKTRSSNRQRGWSRLPVKYRAKLKLPAP